jgi:hypothetical protein
MILPPEAWMDLRRFKPLREAAATWKEIAAELGLDPRTVKKYINGPAVPPSAPKRIGTQPRLIEHLAPVDDAWLTTDITLRASVIHERLVAEHGFPGSYQRVKLYVARPGRGSPPSRGYPGRCRACIAGSRPPRARRRRWTGAPSPAASPGRWGCATSTRSA